MSINNFIVTGAPRTTCRSLWPNHFQHQVSLQWQIRLNMSKLPAGRSTRTCRRQFVNSVLSTLGCQLRAINSWLSTLGCQLCAINSWLSTLGCQLCAINCLLSTLGCQLVAVSSVLSTLRYAVNSWLSVRCLQATGQFVVFAMLSTLGCQFVVFAMLSAFGYIRPLKLL